MSDNSRPEKDALRDVWPSSKQLLFIFHVLQAEWCWLMLAPSINRLQETRWSCSRRSMLSWRFFSCHLLSMGVGHPPLLLGPVSWQQMEVPPFLQWFHPHNAVQLVSHWTWRNQLCHHHKLYTNTPVTRGNLCAPWQRTLRCVICTLSHEKVQCHSLQSKLAAKCIRQSHFTASLR